MPWPTEADESPAFVRSGHPIRSAGRGPADRAFESIAGRAAPTLPESPSRAIMLPGTERFPAATVRLDGVIIATGAGRT